MTQVIYITEYGSTNSAENNTFFSTGNDGYNIQETYVTLVINSSVYVAAGGGYGGAAVSTGYPGCNAVACYDNGTIYQYATIKNYGYLIGGGGGGGGGQNSVSGGNGGSGGGGGGGAGNGYPGADGAGFDGLDSNASNNAGAGGGGYNGNGGTFESYSGGTGSMYGGGGGASIYSAGGNAVSTSYYGNDYIGGTGSSCISYNDNGAGGGGAGGGAGGSSLNEGNGGGGSGGGLGGINNSTTTGHNGGNGGFGISFTNSGAYNTFTLENAQGVLPYNGSTYYGPLYINGYLPWTYNIYITNSICYGQLFLGPASSLLYNYITNFAISTDCYSNIALLFTSTTQEVTFTNIFYNNGCYNNDIHLTENTGYPTSDSPFNFTYNNVTYSYYVSNYYTSPNAGIDLHISIQSISTPYSIYGNNSITCSNYSNTSMCLYGNLTINPSYSNTIIGIQCGSTASFGDTSYTIYFKNSFPTTNIIVILTPFFMTNTTNCTACPQLAVVSQTYFTWYPIYNNGGSDYQNDGSYYICWMAICYA